jgi:peptide/nickel transport system permease protein
LRTYIIRRLIYSVIVLIIVTLLVFLAMHLLPGDPILIYVSSGQLTQSTTEAIALLHHEYGLDKPVIVQYLDWLGGIIHGDLGTSISRHMSVTELIKLKLPITLYLSLLALMVSIILGIPAGILSAIRRGTWIDNIVTIIANAGITIPSFWLGVILIYVFSLKLGWLPTSGYTSPFVDLGKSLSQAAMPVFCEAIFAISAFTRQTRSSMLEVMRQDYIRTAWSKGLKERIVITRHGIKNGLIPVIALIGMSLSMVLGGSVLIETVFNIPGLGRLLVQAVFAKDYQIVQGFVFVIAILILLINLIVDISYGWFDPRIRYN